MSLLALAHGKSNTDALLPLALWDTATSLCFLFPNVNATSKMPGHYY